MEQCQQCQRWSVDRNEEGDLYCMHSATCGYRRSKKDDDRMMALAQLNRQLDDEVKDVARSRDDAQRALDDLKAQLARWKEALGEWLWNCTNLLGDYHIKTVQDFNEEVNRRIAWLMQHLDYTLPPPMTEEERDRMRKLSEDNVALQADNECKDSLIETLQAQLRQVLEVEHKYRKELWLGHRHHGMYGDDGEMQCIECHPYGVTDYKRDPLDKVEHAAFQARIHRATQAAKDAGKEVPSA